MYKPFRDHEMLDVIGNLSSRGESGRLQIRTGMTEGAVFFDKGQIVDASLGKLTGFQAINALASIPDAACSFDRSIAPPVESSITANERILLNDFFGIGGRDRNPHNNPHNIDATNGPTDNPPAEVLCLSEVEDRDNASHDEHVILDGAEELTLVRRKRRSIDYRRAIGYEPVSKRRLSPALFATALLILLAVGVVALVYRFRGHIQSPFSANVSETPKTGADVASGVPDLTGNWKVVNTVEQTAYQPYRNLEIGFEVAINQNGNEFTGKGQKVSENGRSLPRTSRTPIVVQGSIDGDKVEATFSESGSARKTSGRFVWRIDKASGGMTGRFASSAARASGRSAATKQY